MLWRIDVKPALFAAAILFMAFTSAASAQWTKTCTAAACTTGNGSDVTTEQVSIGIEAQQADSSDAAVNIAVFAQDEPMQTLRYLIPGKVDFTFTGDMIDCSANACYVSGLIGNQGVADLKRANILELTATYESGKKRNFGVSLKGFTKAYDGAAAVSTPEASEAEIEAQAIELRKRLSEQSKAASASAQEPLWTKQCKNSTSCVTQGPAGTQEGEVSSIWIESDLKYDLHTIFIKVPAEKDDPLRYQVAGSNIFTLRPMKCELSSCEYQGQLDPSDVNDLETTGRLDLWTAFGTSTERSFQVPLTGFKDAFRSRPAPESPDEPVAAPAKKNAVTGPSRWTSECRDEIVCVTESNQKEPGARVWVRTNRKFGDHDIHIEVPAVDGAIYSLRLFLPTVDDRSFYSGMSCYQDTCQFSERLFSDSLANLSKARLLRVTAAYDSAPSQSFTFDLSGFSNALSALSETSATPAEQTQVAAQETDSKQAELEALRTRAAELEAQIAAEAKGFETQKWTHICPAENSCAIYSWTLSSDDRPVAMVAWLDEQTFSISFNKSADADRVLLTWPARSGPEQITLDDCATRPRCVATLQLPPLAEMLSTLPDGGRFEIKLTEGSGEDVTASVPGAGFVAALISPPLDEKGSEAHLSAAAAEMKAFQ